MISRLTLDQLLQSPDTSEIWSPIQGQNYLVVDAASSPSTLIPEMVSRPVCPVIVCGAVTSEDPLWGLSDLVLEEAEQLDVVTRALDASPVAGATVVRLARHNVASSCEDGLLAESLAYSSLQHGAHFEAWLANRPAASSRQPRGESAVLVTRSDEVLWIELNCPERHNAFSREVRDGLCEALQLPLMDRSITRVILKGAGPSFCSGGDLDEFGEARDGAMAHLVRMSRSAARLMSQLDDRLECHLHGACIGAGVELPSFTGRVVASPDSFFQLPEVSFGLVPGAGGSVSIPRRIGRHRFNWLAISNAVIDAETALAWGLVDDLTGSTPS